MNQGLAARHEVIIAGVGGKGALAAGLLLAQAALTEYKYVVWFPSYASSMRGAPSECTVIFSSQEIASPILPQAKTLILLAPSYLPAMQKRVRAGGTILSESAGFPLVTERKDIKFLTLPALDVAQRLGDLRVANLVLLGAYLGISRALPSHLVMTEIEKKFSGEEALRNKQALLGGMKLTESLRKE